MTHPAFILASSSPRRLALLADIGVVPDIVVAADIVETPQPKEKPRFLAERLSLQKLQAVSPEFEEKDAFILAADTVVGVGRRILPKAETPDDVRKFLNLMSGRRHHVYTGVALRTPKGKVLHRVSDSTVIFHLLSREDIDAYAECGEGIGKAGGYAIQGRAAALIRFISGSYSGIVGLPLFEVAQMLRGAGWRF
ncbi:MAG: nucleoside triphosphate pyrophosphatase [Bdellovibrionales bacterium]|jgi:septum formation protein